MATTDKDTLMRGAGSFGSRNTEDITLGARENLVDSAALLVQSFAQQAIKSAYGPQDFNAPSYPAGVVVIDNGGALQPSDVVSVTDSGGRQRMVPKAMVRSQVEQMISDKITLTSLSADPASGLSYDSGTGNFSQQPATNAQPGYLTSADHQAFSNKLGPADVVASSPLSWNAGTSSMTISQASAVSSGFLGSGDFATFAAKQDQLTGTVQGSMLAYDIGASSYVERTGMLYSISPTPALGVTGNILATGGVALSQVTKTADYTLESTDYMVLSNVASGGVLYTLPDASTVPGRIYGVCDISGATNDTTNTITIQAAVGQINGAGSYAIVGPRSGILLQSDGANYAIISTAHSKADSASTAGIPSDPGVINSGDATTDGVIDRNRERIDYLFEVAVRAGLIEP